MRSVPPSAHSVPPPAGSGRSIPPASRRSFDAVRLNVAAMAERAVQAAARRATRYGLTGAVFRDVIERVDARTETYERVLATVERREVLVEYEPGLGARPTEVKAALDPSRVDPWTAERASLRERSRRVVSCDACEGAGVQRCRKCGGEGALACPYCHGARQRDGKACEGCTGVGSVVCGSCTSGSIKCPTCAGAGLRYTWLRLDVRMSQVVTVDGDAAAILAHEGVRSPADFDLDARRWKNDMFFDTGADGTLDDLPPTLVPVVDEPHERVLRVRLQSFASSVHSVVVKTMLGSSEFQVAGVPPAVLPSSKVALLRLYRTLVLAVAGAGVWLSVMAKIGHERAHPWFAAHGVGWPILATALVASGAGVYAASILLLATRAWRPGRLAPALGVAVAFGAVSAALPRLARPSLERARAALVAGRNADARAEAEALVATGRDVVGARALLDQVLAAELSAAPLASAVARAGAPRFHSPDARRDASAAVRARVDAERARLVATGDAAGLFALGDLARPLDPELARRAFDAGAEVAVARCAEQGTVPCEFRGGELPDARRVELERRLELSYARRNVDLGEWDALGKRLERWSKQPTMAAEVQPLQALAHAELGRRYTILVEAERSTSDPHARLDLAEKQLSVGRMMVRVGGAEPPPGLAALVRKQQAAAAAVEAVEAAATLRRRR